MPWKKNKSPILAPVLRILNSCWNQVANFISTINNYEVWEPRHGYQSSFVSRFHSATKRARESRQVKVLKLITVEGFGLTDAEAFIKLVIEIENCARLAHDEDQSNQTMYYFMVSVRSSRLGPTCGSEKWNRWTIYYGIGSHFRFYTEIENPYTTKNKTQYKAREACTIGVWWRILIWMIIRWIWEERTWDLRYIILSKLQSLT